MFIEKLASQIKNDIVSGLRGYHQNLSINLKQLEDEVVQTRLQVMHDLIAKGTIPIRDLLVAINCVDVDCKSLERCGCKSEECETNARHFQIPQLVNEFGDSAIEYIGSVDRQNPFTVLRSLSEFKMMKYRKRGKNKPYVWIDFAPNSNGMLDCFVFNCPYLEMVSVVGVFKDPRQVERYGCCTGSEFETTGADDNISYINQEIKDAIIANKINYYRQYAASVMPNDQKYTTGN